VEPAAEGLAELDPSPFVVTVRIAQRAVGVDTVAQSGRDLAQPAHLQRAGGVDEDRLALADGLVTEVVGRTRDHRGVLEADLARAQRLRGLGQRGEMARGGHRLGGGAGRQMAAVGRPGHDRHCAVVAVAVALLERSQPSGPLALQAVDEAADGDDAFAERAAVEVVDRDRGQPRPRTGRRAGRLRIPPYHRKV
jgi:hypothetical protein